MRILYAALKYDYGDPAAGLGFEHYNFFDTLHRMGHDIQYFDFGTLVQKQGREVMNQNLVERAKTDKPDLLLTVLHDDELDPKAIRAVTDSGIPTVNWFCDDHWRFENYSRHWAPSYRWVVTTAKSALPKYEKIGYRGAIKSQWACNPFLYRPLGLPPGDDVTFVGMTHGERRGWIETIRHSGIPVKAWGTGWETGRLDQDQMIRVFNQSRINLNLSNASAPQLTGSERLRFQARRIVSSALEATAGGRQIKMALRSLRHQEAPTERDIDLSAGEGSHPNQIKGRDFEVPGCGGFLLTGGAEDFQEYFRPGKEVVCYSTLGDLIEKVRYYLAHEEERKAIAEAGAARVRREHTYVHRFSDIFRQMGLTHEPADQLLAHPPTPGRVQEIL